jgi:hypothetical protein
MHFNLSFRIQRVPGEIFFFFLLFLFAMSHHLYSQLLMVTKNYNFMWLTKMVILYKWSTYCMLPINYYLITKDQVFWQQFAFGGWSWCGFGAFIGLHWNLIGCGAVVAVVRQNWILGRPMYSFSGLGGKG